MTPAIPLPPWLKWTIVADRPALSDLNELFSVTCADNDWVSSASDRIRSAAFAIADALMENEFGDALNELPYREARAAMKQEELSPADRAILKRRDELRWIE